MTTNVFPLSKIVKLVEQLEIPSGKFILQKVGIPIRLKKYKALLKGN